MSISYSSSRRKRAFKIPIPDTPDARVGLEQARVLLRDVLSVGGINALHPRSPPRAPVPLPLTPTSARWIPAGAVGRVAVPDDDGSVIEALRRGDKIAFAHLVDHYHASLRRVARLSGKPMPLLSARLASRTTECRVSRSPQCAGAESYRGASCVEAGHPIHAAGRWIPRARRRSSASP